MTRTESQRKPSPVPREQIDAGSVGPEDVEPDATVDETPESGRADDVDPPGDQRGARGRRRRAVIVVLAVLVIAAASATWYVANQPGPADVRPAVAKDGSYTLGSLPSDAGAAALDAATDGVPQALSYDYRSLDTTLTKAVKGMTPKFADTFTQTFTSVVKPMATENKAVTQALIRGAGLADLSDDERTATCVLFVDQLLVTSNGKTEATPHVGKERVSVTVRNVEGTWLIADIQPF